jgi:transcription-repair coupling factor (superfamily II helicase)
MHLSGLLPALRETAAFTELCEYLQNTREPLQEAVIRAARPYVVATLTEQQTAPTLIVCGRTDRAHDIAEQLLAWLPEARVLRLQEPGPMFYDHAPWTETTIRSRIQVLAALAPPIRVRDPQPEPPPIIVASIHALMQRTLPVREFRRVSRQLRIGAQQDPDKLLHHLVKIGYGPVSVVTQPGTFGRRGGIIDLFPPVMKHPVRVEFFGDEIDSLRTFNPATQRSVDSLDHFVLTPAREVLPEHLPALGEQLESWFATQPPLAENVDSLLDDLTHLVSGTAFPHAEYYLPLVYPTPTSLLDYLPQDAMVVVDDWDTVYDLTQELETQALETRQDRTERELLPPDMPLPYHTWDELQDALTAHGPLHLGMSDIPATLGFAPEKRFGGQVRLFLDHLQSLNADETAIVVTRQAQRLAELWRERNTAAIHPRAYIDDMSNLPNLVFVEGELGEGWSLETNGRVLHLFTDAEIFGWQRPEPRRRVQKRSVNPEAHFADLQEDDFVVHVDFGVGQFKGVQKRRLQDTEREYLVIEYAGGDVLHVPIHQADRVSKYVGVQGKSPTLNRLGNQDWSRTKQRTEKAVQEVAEELLGLYAARSIVEGHAFSPDGPWQHELEASFPYVETDDQSQALNEVKADMESAYPMDRLLCGDVGYGKTEVALRAAFKAVTDHKQVAVLVPTTVLAQQHYMTFTQRLVAFPLRVEMLSRFKTRAEQQVIIEDLRAGKVDIVVGTHRLLQNDVQFRDLGLVVIDEEQRFGVTHKERLKRLRTEIDVLTMTATPIPRTLYMGLTGLRDISLIQTAPEERLPVINHVGPSDERMLRQAVLREIDRGGQVFVVHNRVKTIYALQKQLQRLVPEASFVVGHGQMDEHELEQVMADFAGGAYDVLICTTIIESGIDIPRANTMIIDRADRFGLSQLYQLRGRVGRSANQGYAYFFYPRNQPLTPEARARLETINEYTDLGVGMSIAVRDLEIRGMGDLLGMRQSGYIDAVGFHLYTQMLTDAVKAVEPEKPARIVAEKAEAAAQPAATTPVTIDMPLPTYIPTDFIDDMALRIQLYRRLANIHTVDDLSAMQAELNDRFGALPPAVEGLLFQIEVKLLAQAAGATAVSTENGRISVKLPYLGSIDRDALQNYLGDEARVSRTALWLMDTTADEVRWQPQLLRVLKMVNRERIAEVALN